MRQEVFPTFVLIATIVALGPACSSLGGSPTLDAFAVYDLWTDPGSSDVASDTANDRASDTARDIPGSPPLLGLLQFHVTHNLADDFCTHVGTCSMSIEEAEDTADWLDAIRSDSNLAVLHWDRPIPYLAFKEPPPEGVDRVSFHETMLDQEILDWLNAFSVHFAQVDKGCLAVSLLGMRDRLQELRVSPDQDLAITGSCPVVNSDVTIYLDYKGPGEPLEASFHLKSTYLNFILYLYDKLSPDYVALLVEANLFKEFCPEQWPGLASLYLSLYDSVRAVVDTRVKLFATLTFTHLLSYDVEKCHGSLPWEPCDGSAPSDGYPVQEPDQEHCFPLDLSPIEDLDQGDRLDMLALSFYPDALLMAPPGINGMQVEVFDTDWDGSQECNFRVDYAPFADPFRQLDRFGWTKPVAIAEWSARSCPTLSWRVNGPNEALARLGGNPESSAFWMGRGLDGVREGDFEFVVWSFLRDYDVLGPWLVEQEIMPPDTFSLLNAWPCSGVRDKDGGTKPGITDLWLEHLGAYARTATEGR